MARKSSKSKPLTTLRKKVVTTRNKKSQVQQKTARAPRGGVTISPIAPSQRSPDPDKFPAQHVPHLIYQNQSRRLSLQGCNPPPSLNAPVRPLVPQSLAHPAILPSGNTLHTLYRYPRERPHHLLPFYIKPIPPRIAPEDVEYLENKGALSVPSTELRNKLLRSYVDYVYNYLPLLDLSDLLRAVEGRSGSDGKLSMLLFQAIMFTGAAFVDDVHLKSAGYSTRRAARKAFYQRTRLLYDFDYEVDRLSVIQALLLMSYWDDTTDDEKDSWHWMGVVISLSNTIGLHRNPENSTMSIRRQRLRKRIWWSCLMRDRLVALGRRNPTRIKEGDYDVPMLVMTDFELEAVDDDITCIPPDCALARSIDMQRQMAILCIEKANLCLCVGHILSAQYPAVNNNIGARDVDGNLNPSTVLGPRKEDCSAGGFRLCDLELTQWYQGLPNEAIYRSPTPLELATGNASLVVHRALLHIIYNTMVSALHWPQVHPESSTTLSLKAQSHQKVHHAASEITALASSLRDHNLAHYLPTTVVLALLPAMITHLLDNKSFSQQTRTKSMQGFRACMEVMKSLQAVYGSVDSAMDILYMAAQEADVNINLGDEHIFIIELEDPTYQHPAPNKPAPVLTPPPDNSSDDAVFVEDDDVARDLQTFLTANTPPDSEGNDPSPGMFGYRDELSDGRDFEVDFENLINLDAGVIKRDTVVVQSESAPGSIRGR
ncbi:MAG: hypothetical protein M1836_004627 [Candelina mexicana]|nr:MAG: hypothetical protein M1836_004627 [Candelina mexicana]